MGKSLQEALSGFQAEGEARRSATRWERMQASAWLMRKVGKVLVLGTQAVGKTTFWNAMQGRVALRAEPTGTFRKKATPAIVNADSEPVVVHLRPDVGGGLDARNLYWENAFLTAQVVVYILNMPLYLGRGRPSDQVDSDAWMAKAATLRKDVNEQLSDIATWQKNRGRPWYWPVKRTPKLLLLGSWCDALPEWSEGGEALDGLHDEFEGHLNYKNVRGSLVQQGLRPDLLLGSLATPASRTAFIDKVSAWMLR